MGFQPSDDTDVESLFPKDVKLTVSDFISGIVFDDEAHELFDDDQTPRSNYTSNNNTARKRTKEFFRRYIDDVYSGKVGTLNASVLHSRTQCDRLLTVCLCLSVRLSVCA